MKRAVIFLTGLFMTVFGVYGQEEKSSFDMSRVTFGGNFGIGLEYQTTRINIAPQIGYFFTPQLNAGAGISYLFYKFNIDGEPGRVNKYNYFGINVFGRYYPTKYIVLHAQPEINYLKGKAGGVKKSEFVPAFIVGAGVNFNGVTLMIQYDVAQNRFSPYGELLFYSIGFSF